MAGLGLAAERWSQLDQVLAVDAMRTIGFSPILKVEPIDWMWGTRERG